VPVRRQGADCGFREQRVALPSLQWPPCHAPAVPLPQIPRARAQAHGKKSSAKRQQGLPADATRFARSLEAWLGCPGVAAATGAAAGQGPTPRAPSAAGEGVPLDLLLLWQAVVDHGGSQEVADGDWWADVAAKVVGQPGSDCGEWVAQVRGSCWPPGREVVGRDQQRDGEPGCGAGRGGWCCCCPWVTCH
jgi:hypothetical protein